MVGAELLALAPLDVKPLDIVAVHAEAEDSNALEGAGVGRSDVVYLEVPLPESDDGGGGGGGGGGGPPPINPLEMQMEILQATVVLQDNAPASDRAAIAHDQRQNAEYVGMIERPVEQKGLTDLALALRKARLVDGGGGPRARQAAARESGSRRRGRAGSLVEASKLLEEAKDLLAPPKGRANWLSACGPPAPRVPLRKARMTRKARANGNPCASSWKR